ncbi:hypothetical protein PPYR_05513 [Photinus pyralis]|uniref:Uncharacterized protein n=1 Tax=Photinus pyralis TaxID=7054 RepID=A0A1Y1NCS4_PHOPY|nr:guanine nucleotide-binding protein subunit beta-like protein 1 [Photinus pyralis]KAB0801159.1 hypothetical protein PPYR_05513 [Photinus pyralis]
MALLPPDPLFILRSDMGLIHNIEFVFDGFSTSHLLAANEEGYIYLWDLKTNRSTRKEKLGASIQAIHYVPPYLISQEKSGAIKLWHMEMTANCTLLKEYMSDGAYCRSIVINNTLIVPQVNSQVEAINLQTFEKIRMYTPLLASPSEKLGYTMALEKVEIGAAVYVLAGYETGDLILWNFLTGEQKVRALFKEHIMSIAFDSVTGKGVCGNSSNLLQVFTIDKDFKIKLKCEILLSSEGCSVVKLRQDRKILACGGWDGRLRLFSWRSLRPLVVLRQHKNAITDVIFSPKIVPEWDCRLMCASGGEGLISLWNLYNQ